MRSVSKGKSYTIKLRKETQKKNPAATEAENNEARDSVALTRREEPHACLCTHGQRMPHKDDNTQKCNPQAWRKGRGVERTKKRAVSFKQRTHGTHQTTTKHTKHTKHRTRVVRASEQGRQHLQNRRQRKEAEGK